MGVLRLRDADDTTVLLDFHDPTGTANPGTVSTKLGAALDLGSIEPDVMAIRTASGSRRRRDARVVVAPGTMIGRTLARQPSASIPASNARVWRPEP